MTARVLLLTPSRGLGGGIERYVATLQSAFAAEGIRHSRLDLRGSGPAAHWDMLRQAVRELRSNGAAARLVLAHPSLLPTGVLAAGRAPVRGISVLCHGCETWDSNSGLRRLLERRLLRSPSVRAVAVSSFTAGVLLKASPAVILPPGLSRDWFDCLVAASALPRSPERGLRLVTAFRLADWQDKGLPQILAAIAALGRRDIQLTVCGSGAVPAALKALVSRHECCAVRADLTDAELAQQLAAADLFVLATRMRTGRHPFGEGFGLVLLEAQLAGTPVVAPAYGGSRDAFLDQVTGASPADESAEALAAVLHSLLSDRDRLLGMGKRAGEWAGESFDPERYARLAVTRLL